MTLRDTVFEALDNAEKNGYDVRSFGPMGFIVDDLKRYVKELEDVPDETLLPIVDAWLTVTK
jgi:hypothetical protein